MDVDIRDRISLKNPIHFLALGFGSGLAKFMPGTVGTLAVLPFIWLAMSTMATLPFIFLTVLVSVIGVWLCEVTARDMGVHDHSSIVWDEFAGMMITMIAIPLSWHSLLIGFVLFRIFDIVKPWPISFLDKNLHGGMGIMLDDIIAGLFALASMHALLFIGFI